MNIERREWKVPKYYIFSVPCEEQRIEETRNILAKVPGIKVARNVSRVAHVILQEGVTQDVHVQPEIRGICHFRENNALADSLFQAGIIDYTNNSRVTFYNLLSLPEDTFVSK